MAGTKVKVKVTQGKSTVSHPRDKFFFHSSQRILFLKFVGILKFVKIREFLEFLKFIKFVFSNYGLDAASPSIVTYSGM